MQTKEIQIYNKIITLVGLMGSGKTRVGGELARLTGLPFIDSDREIEQAAHSSIAEIFEKSGEAEFRLKEKQMMLRLLSGQPCVLAAGGGAFIQPDVRHAVKERAISVWLKTSLQAAVDRISNNDSRPLLRGVSVENKLRELMDVRYPVYAEADITVVTDGRTPQDIAQLIKKEADRLVQK